MEENLPLYTIAVNNYEYLQGVYVSYERALEDACQMAREDMILNDVEIMNILKSLDIKIEEVNEVIANVPGD